MAKLVSESLNEKFSSAENALRIDVRWTIKARDLSEVKTLYVTSRIQEYLDKIKSVPYYVLDQRLTTSIPGKLQERIFICKGIDGENYLVNPEGFDYARGVVRLVIPTAGEENNIDESYENNNKKDNDFMHGLTGDEVECDVCARLVLHQDLENGLCKRCIEQGFWKDNQDNAHHKNDK